MGERRIAELWAAADHASAIAKSLPRGSNGRFQAFYDACMLMLEVLSLERRQRAEGRRGDDETND